MLGVIFDRDGVLIEDLHYMVDSADIRWTPGAIDLIRLLNARGVKVLVASNQSGIARGYFSETQVAHFHAEMKRQLSKHQAWIDAIAYCPHHPDAGDGAYTMDCECRKPKPGMLLKLMQDQGLAPSTLLMVGDRDVDMDAAANAGIEGLRFQSGNLQETMALAGHLSRLPDHGIDLSSDARALP